MALAVYFANWSIYARGYAPHKVPCDRVTHVVYAFFKPNPETGEVALSDPWADVQKKMPLGGDGCIGEFALLKKQYRHLRVLLSVGGWTYSGDLTRIFTDPTKLAVFIKSVLKLVEMYKFDGIDVDWEYASSPSEGRLFANILADLRRGLNNLEQQYGCELDLTVAAPAGPDNVKNLPLQDMDKQLTFWNLMTYDFSGSWSRVAAHQANLWGGDLSGDSVIRQYMSGGVRPAKLVLGMPIYGRSFAGARRLGDSFNGVLPGRFEQGTHDAKDLPLNGSREETDSKQGAAFCAPSEGFVTYDNAATVVVKADYARTQGLGGGMFYEASGDRHGEQSLISAFSSRFRPRLDRINNWI